MAIQIKVSEEDKLRLLAMQRRLNLAKKFQEASKDAKKYQLTDEKRKFIEDFLFGKREKVDAKEMEFNFLELETLFSAVFPEFQSKKVTVGKLVKERDEMMEYISALYQTRGLEMDPNLVKFLGSRESEDLTYFDACLISKRANTNSLTSHLEKTFRSCEFGDLTTYDSLELWRQLEYDPSVMSVKGEGSFEYLAGATARAIKSFDAYKDGNIFEKSIFQKLVDSEQVEYTRNGERQYLDFEVRRTEEVRVSQSIAEYETYGPRYETIVRYENLNPKWFQEHTSDNVKILEDDKGYYMVREPLTIDLEYLKNANKKFARLAEKENDAELEK